MLSIIIATCDSERPLVPTLAALVAGATAGIVREVIVADGGSRDQTEGVADVAGCRFLASSEPLGARLNAAAKTARGDWLMFLAPGGVPGITWIDEVAAFNDRAGIGIQGAVFAAENTFISAFRRRFLLPVAWQGLIVRKSTYESLGGHRPGSQDPEINLLRRIGRRRLVTLRTTIHFPDI